MRLADGTGAHTHERVCGLGDPAFLSISNGTAALLALTTLLGLVWRLELRGGERAGNLVTALAVMGAASVWILTAAGVVSALTAARLGSARLGISIRSAATQPDSTAALVFDISVFGTNWALFMTFVPMVLPDALRDSTLRVGWISCW